LNRKLIPNSSSRSLPVIISYLSVSSTKAFQLIFLVFMKCRESKLDFASFVGLEASSL
jgi:hypothetical protein